MMTPARCRRHGHHPNHRPRTRRRTPRRRSRGVRGVRGVDASARNMVVVCGVDWCVCVLVWVCVRVCAWSQGLARAAWRGGDRRDGTFAKTKK